MPGAIGSIAWLAKNEKKVSAIKHGLVVAGVGDSGCFHYKKSRIGQAEIDRVVHQVLKHSGQKYEIHDFSPYGYDERQYCSPGFNLPVGSLTRTPHGMYPEYHTSADNLEFVKPDYLSDSLEKYLQVIRAVEGNRTYVNQYPKCEVRLGKRGLYRAVGGQTDQPLHELALLWVLNLSDGQHSLLDIVERSSLALDVIYPAAKILHERGLLVEAQSQSYARGTSGEVSNDHRVL